MGSLLITIHQNTCPLEKIGNCLITPTRKLFCNEVVKIQNGQVISKKFKSLNHNPSVKKSVKIPLYFLWSIFGAPSAGIGALLKSCANRSNKQCRNVSKIIDIWVNRQQLFEKTINKCPAFKIAKAKREMANMTLHTLQNQTPEQLFLLSPTSFKKAYQMNCEKKINEIIKSGLQNRIIEVKTVISEYTNKIERIKKAVLEADEEFLLKDLDIEYDVDYALIDAKYTTLKIVEKFREVNRLLQDALAAYYSSK